MTVVIAHDLVTVEGSDQSAPSDASSNSAKYQIIFYLDAYEIGIPGEIVLLPFYQINTLVR